MLIIEQKGKRLLAAAYPHVLELTGIVIFIAGILCIAALTKFNVLSPIIYHAACLFIAVVATWWCCHFFYKGMKLLEQDSPQKKEARQPPC
ncbi:hypothetical protein [Candidatus Magnetobacterium casense]|uniref:Uncharacterized protein n=1 Tax=Candidatus Magnetobacterium casense TaxID=1455061 RepID=A0ABS6S2E6_9BACT|nr:hypothetical protein [Candidatus Magnetobacterium casensis]MBV6343022.1 hypothetical protein [Candidatus Magnetobacterium casensis]